MGRLHACQRFIALMPGEEALPVQLERATEILEETADLAPLRAVLSAAPSGEGPAEVSIFRFVLAYFDRDADGLARAIAELKPWIEKAAGASMVYQPTYGDLKLNPMWDPLRGDPRFSALIERLAPAKARSLCPSIRRAR